MTQADLKTEPVENAIDVVSRVAKSCGWEISGDGEPLFQNNISFVARTQLIGYGVNVSKITAGTLHVELVVQLQNVPCLVRTEFMRLLNMVNQNISVGSLIFTSEKGESEEEPAKEFLIHRSQLYFDETVGLSENQVINLISSCIGAFDLCLPHITTFLATKPVGKLDKDSGEIIGAYLKLTPEDTLDLIMCAPYAGHA